ncbi:MAG TPA: Rne/Rng family ribonuclease [Paludibaculum sp.]|jgi:ribonuclease G
MSSKELVISQGRHETKVGILEDGQLVEVYFQRANEYSLAGSIHKGRVTRVLPGMQSAFVDVGLERDCFLYVSDFFEENADEIDRVGEDRRPSRDRGERTERPERGDRDRDRGRGRGRGRDRDSEPVLLATPVLRLAEPAAEPPAEGEEPVVAVATDAAATPADPAAKEARTDRGDRRGRRSRRRRRGGSKGIPDAKYASPEDEQLAEGEEGDNEADDDAADEAPVIEASESAAETVEESEDDASAESAPSDGSLEEVILLPGESLAKYRRDDSAAEPELTEDELQAAAEAAAEDAAEEILDRVEELESRAELVLPEVDPVNEDDGLESDSEAEPEAESESEPETGEEESPEAVIGEANDAVSEESESIEPAEEEGAATEAAADGTAEPSGEPESLTATLREPGGSAPHRISRRLRRRGRGGRGVESNPDTTEASPSPEAVPAVEGEDTVPEAAPAEPLLKLTLPDRSERPERSDRSERPERTGRPVRTERTDRNDAPDSGERRDRPPMPSISDLLKEGQEIIVQIAKEPLGQKGARITSHIALPGRYVVYMPTVEHLGVSRKISTDEERQRLKKILQKHREGVAGGYIMRTAGEGRTEEDIQADMQFLAALWLDIRAKADKRRAPALLHHDVEVVQRLIRDQLTDGFKAVWVDNEDLYEQVLHSVERVAPAMLSRVKLYTRPEPIFEAFGIAQELEKALRPKVWLKSGGYIVINQTEALVAIDVNTGKYVGKSNRLEDTIVKTNVEAVKEIVRQMRLRDLGGIIVVDFIDMDERKNRQRVMLALEEEMRADKAPYKILQFNDFGLVAITRKRVKQSLERALCAPCPYCEGAGYVKSVGTVIGEIMMQAQKYAKVVDTKDVLLRVHPEVAKMLKSLENQYLEELEETLGRPVLVTSDPNLHQEKFDLA